MNETLIKDIEQALARAKENNIPVSEIWLGPQNFGSAQIAIDGKTIKREPVPNNTTNDTMLTYNGFRIRQMVQEGVRAGTTTCQFGPGVT